ncbi:MAG: hypothetical protein R2699_13785 [Acidimicrobiales bacterium]
MGVLRGIADAGHQGTAPNPTTWSMSPWPMPPGWGWPGVAAAAAVLWPGEHLWWT